MEEKTDRIKKESQDKIRKFKSKGIFSLNNVIVKKNGNVKTKHYLTPKKQQKKTNNDLQNIKAKKSLFFSPQGNNSEFYRNINSPVNKNFMIHSSRADVD